MTAGLGVAGHVTLHVSKAIGAAGGGPRRGQGRRLSRAVEACLLAGGAGSRQGPRAVSCFPSQSLTGCDGCCPCSGKTPLERPRPSWGRATLGSTFCFAPCSWPSPTQAQMCEENSIPHRSLYAGLPQGDSHQHSHRPARWGPADKGEVWPRPPSPSVCDSERGQRLTCATLFWEKCRLVRWGGGPASP